MIPPEIAWQRVEERLESLPVESTERRQAAGRVLTRRLVAMVDVPAHDVSAMDGFALVGDSEPGQILPISGTVAAGDPPGHTLIPGTALRIMTGAPMPLGADRVVPVEQTTSVGEGEVRIDSIVTRLAHVRRRAEVLETGRLLLPPSTPLSAGAISLLATHGYETVEVHRRPTVAVLATGDEVVPPATTPGPGQLRDSNTDFLLAAGRSLGLDFTALGIAADHPDVVHEQVARGLEFDVLLIGGGVSMGEFDFVEGALEELECEVLFDAVAIQPGKPLVVARHSRGWVCGLPGNPASVMVGFWLFVRPLLRRLQGIPDRFWSGAIRAELAAPLPGAKDRDRFLSAHVRFDSGRLLVRPIAAKGSHDLAAFAFGTALVRIPAHTAPAEPGQTCEILPFVDWPDWPEPSQSR